MAKSEGLGEFEHLMLLALLRLDDGAYGVQVRRLLEEATKREISIGAVQATLDRLERKGYVKSWMGEPLAQRGGKARRHYAVLPGGRDAVDRAERAFGVLRDAQVHA